MIRLPATGPAPRTDRPATQLVHDEANVRIVRFCLAPGQVVAPHASESTVTVLVVRGAGLFRGESGELSLGPGEGALYAPGEVHGMEARDAGLEFLAILSPRPA